jgi:hypothetical protein
MLKQSLIDSLKEIYIFHGTEWTGSNLNVKIQSTRIFDPQICNDKILSSIIIQSFIELHHEDDQYDKLLWLYNHNATTPKEYKINIKSSNNSHELSGFLIINNLEEVRNSDGFHYQLECKIEGNIKSL